MDATTWSDTLNLGNPINTAAGEMCPMVSPDGEYLFYIQMNTDEIWEIYWVAIKKRIDTLRFAAVPAN